MAKYTKAEINQRRAIYASEINICKFKKYYSYSKVNSVRFDDLASKIYIITTEKLPKETRQILHNEIKLMGRVLANYMVYEKIRKGGLDFINEIGDMG